METDEKIIIFSHFLNHLEIIKLKLEEKNHKCLVR